MLAPFVCAVCSAESLVKQDSPDDAMTEFSVHPIGYVRKEAGRTTIVLKEEYRPALLRLDRLSHVWILWWFDGNDTPEKRSILQVHRQGDASRPLTGVFATHAPVRPNPIGMTRCELVSVTKNVIGIDGIDAFADTALLGITSG